MGLFNSIHPSKFPHVQKHFVVFAQLTSGLGQIPFYLDVRFARTGQLIHTTNTQTLTFPHRDKLVQMAYTMQGCVFPQPGMYLIELYCNAQWVADCPVELL